MPTVRRLSQAVTGRDLRSVYLTFVELYSSVSGTGSVVEKVLVTRPLVNWSMICSSCHDNNNYTHTPINIISISTPDLMLGETLALPSLFLV